MKEFPATLSVEDRNRLAVTKEAENICYAMTRAREILQQKLTDRMFHGREDLRPSNSRLIQAYMSKQMPSSTYLPASWNAHARTLYLQALRDAVVIARVSTRAPSPRKSKVQKVAPKRWCSFAAWSSHLHQSHRQLRYRSIATRRMIRCSM